MKCHDCGTKISHSSSVLIMSPDKSSLVEVCHNCSSNYSTLTLSENIELTTYDIKLNVSKYILVYGLSFLIYAFINGFVMTYFQFKLGWLITLLLVILIPRAIIKSMKEKKLSNIIIGIPKGTKVNLPADSTIEEDPIRFCRKCGCKLPENAVFCNKCGTEIIKE